MVIDDRRRPDLDALRVIAFAILILFHCGLVYTTWGFPVHSRWASTAIEPLMLLSAPWRLELLFLISGVATRYLWDKSSGPLGFAQARAWRLLPPLACGFLLLAPLQVYWAHLAAGGEPLGYLDFLRGWLWLQPELLPTGVHRSLVHVWFIAYLAAYTAILLPLGLLNARRRRGLRTWDGAAPSWLWLLAPVLGLAVLRQLLFDRFGDTHQFWGDWYNHARYGGIFLLGFLVAKAPGFWAATRALRWHALVVAGLAYASYSSWFTYFVYELNDNYPIGSLEAWLERGLRNLFAWSAILAALGWAQLAIRQRSRLIAYLSEAVFPYYLTHQPILVAAWLALDPLHLPPFAEAGALILLTAIGTGLSYEVLRRLGPLRPLFGLKELPFGRTGPIRAGAHGGAEPALPKASQTP